MKVFMKKIILFLIRKRLGLKKFECFRFSNQKSNAFYYFTDSACMKYWKGVTEKSHVSLNWLLDDDCKIEDCGYKIEREFV